MDWTVVITCLLIVLARVTDITLDTIRTVAIVQGRRTFAAVLGFVEAAVFICAVAKVLENFHHPAYAVAYAGGFALGTFLGITIEQHLAFGEQLAALVTRRGPEVAAGLRAAGFRVTELAARGRDGQLSVLYVEVPRRQMQVLLDAAQQLDGEYFYIVNDVRLAAHRPRRPRRRLAA